MPPPKQKSKSRLDTQHTEQPIKAWEQGLQLATFSEEVYFLWTVVLFTAVVIHTGPYEYPFRIFVHLSPDPDCSTNPNPKLPWGVTVHATLNSDSATYRPGAPIKSIHGRRKRGCGGTMSPHFWDQGVQGAVQ